MSFEEVPAPAKGGGSDPVTAALVSVICGNSDQAAELLEQALASGCVGASRWGWGGELAALLACTGANLENDESETKPCFFRDFQAPVARRSAGLRDAPAR